MSSDQMTKVLERLKSIRERTDLTLRKTKHLKDTFTGFDGTEHPLSLRYYQVQGVLHLVMMKRFIIGDDTGLGKCCRCTGKVLTNEGLVALGDLAPSGVVLKPDTFYDMTRPVNVWTGRRWARIKKFYFSGMRPVKKVVTRRGYETVATLVHPLKVRRPGGNVFIETRNLTIGDYACLDRSPVPFPQEEPSVPVPDKDLFQSNAIIYPVPDRMNPDLASLLAYVVGEGCTNGRLSISIAQSLEKNPEIHQHIRDLCLKLFGWNKDGNYKIHDMGVKISSVYLRSYFQGLGVGECLAESKRVPEVVFRSTKESVRAFLRAFFDGECSFTGGFWKSTVLPNNYSVKCSYFFSDLEFCRQETKRKSKDGNTLIGVWLCAGRMPVFSPRKLAF
jgi:hypothetical protein